MKVIVLVTSSDDQSIYAKHREVWKKYMNKHAEVETYFIQSSEEYSETTLVGDTLWTSGKEGYPTNLERIIGGARVDKTVSALRWLFEHKQFDYVVRTGLSAVWIYRNLVPFLQTLPIQGVYCGTDGGGFVSGAGMILSPDVCKILVDKKDPYKNGEEDCVISSYLQYCGVVITPYNGRIGYSSLEECKRWLHSAPPNAFQFRIKTSCIDEKRGEEPDMMMCILRHYNVC